MLGGTTRMQRLIAAVLGFVVALVPWLALAQAGGGAGGGGGGPPAGGSPGSPGGGGGGGGGGLGWVILIAAVILIAWVIARRGRGAPRPRP